MSFGLESSPDPIQHRTDSRFPQNTRQIHLLPNTNISQTSAQDNIYPLSSATPPTEASKSINDCENCISKSRDRKPFDQIALCNKCQHQWINFLPSLLKTDSGSVTQMLYNCHIRLTRTMAQELVDEFGFGLNVHGYRRHRPIKIVFPQDKIKKECVGVLCRLHQGKVKVWVPELRMVEWLPVGTRRIKLMDPQEEKDAEPVLRGSIPTIDDLELLSDEQMQPARGTTRSKRTRLHPPAQAKSSHTLHKHQESTRANTPNGLSSITPSTINRAYLTTGAFATRKAVHQLKDDNGFIPNPFSYARNQAVQILDTKYGKSKTWYNGTLVEMRPGYVKVHYNQWPETYDEWLIIGSRRIRIADGTATNGMSRSDEQLMAMAQDPDAEHFAKRKKQSLELQQKRQKSTSSGSEQSGTGSIKSRRLAHLKAVEAEQFSRNAYGYYYMQHVDVLYHDKRYYEARIIGVQKDKVKIHYCGWTDSFDELISNGSQRLKITDSTNQAACLEPAYLERDKHTALVKSSACDKETASANTPLQMETKVAVKLDTNKQETEEEEGELYVDAF